MDSLNTGDVEIAAKAMRAHVRYRMEDVIRRREMQLTQAQHSSILAVVPAADGNEPSPATGGNTAVSG